MSEASVLWRRVDAPGHDACRLARDGDEWRLSGAAVFAHESAPVRLDYQVHADAAWRTRRATVSGWVGGDAVRVEAQVDEGGRWTVDGRDRPDLAGCVDVDLAFTPATNLLP